MATYPVTASMGQQGWCPACRRLKAIYVMVEDGERITCCAFCQRILAREIDAPKT